MLHSIDNHGRIMEVSDLWLQKLGYTTDEVIGRPSIEFLSEASACYAREVVLPEFWKTGACEVEYDMVRKDGVLIPVRLHGIAVRNESGAFVRSIAVIEDLRERRALERKMFEVQKLESLGLMAGNIAHDFNNLLASIFGSAEIALRHARHIRDAASALDNILIASERAADLCRQLLAYSGRGRFHVEAMVIDDLVDEMVTVLEVTIGKDARMVLELARDGARVEVDATQIRQIVMNLVINAAESLGGKPGTITITTHSCDLDAATIARGSQPDIEPGPYLCLTIKDDGCGMDANVLAHLFDPFFTTKPAGHGLGLAAVHGIVRGHRGALTVTSEVGGGTAFMICLPLAGDTVPKAASGVRARLSNRRGTVMVVDDDDLLRRTLARQLGDAGFQVLVAPTAGEARRLIASTAVTAFLIDVSMPGTSGPELAGQISALVPDADIILMSGFDRVDLPRLPGTTPARFLQKPFTEEELLGALDRGPGLRNH